MVTKEVLDQLIQAVGKENVITEKEDLICYSFDATAGLSKSIPTLLVTPRNQGDVVSIVKIANDNKLPICTRGAGTNLSGGTIPASDGIVMSMLKMNRILEIDAENLTATVQPGVVVQTLNNEVAKFGLIYPPDPGSVATATMGGTVAECAGGLRGLKYGVTKHYIMGLEVVMANGDIIRCGGKTVKNVSGYDLTKLFVGSEGTLGIITEIIVKLIPAPEFSRSMIAVFDDLDNAAKTITDVIANKVIPATMEIMDNVVIRCVENYAKVGLPVDAEAVLLLEVDGIKEVVEREAQTVINVCKQNGAVEVRMAKTEEEKNSIWTARRAALPALAQMRPTLIMEDATVPRSKIPEMMRAIVDIGKKYDLMVAIVGHAGDGNLHPFFLTDASNKEEMDRVEKAVDEVFATALKLGGTLSGEHGIGVAKAKFMEWEFGKKGIEVMKKIKDALDPNDILNPGKIFV